ncbi:carbonyl reductase [Echinococcus granulosus]|uniref:Carbonyl reductase n=1 Tax=Echinococcus granulosus TaxID=6210 RepID=W6UHY0_ECHGR|nr:carbonyl reductase [Echinococcus granulosus]EUB61095.1 carbonyl reductase [Echinococcus granulosus]
MSANQPTGHTLQSAVKVVWVVTTSLGTRRSTAFAAWATMHVAIVTGANKGIGNGIVQLLVQGLKPASDWHVYLTARNEKLGMEAVKRTVERSGTTAASNHSTFVTYGIQGVERQLSLAGINA